MAEARTFRVALVRARGKRRGRVRLQALRREMALVVGDAELRVGMRAETQAVVVRVSAEEIKGVRVKGRLVRVRKDSAALTVRFESKQDAINAATAMMDAYGIDPEIQTLRGETSPAAEEQDRLGEIAAQYLVSPELRRSVQELHRQLERLLADGDGGSGDMRALVSV